MSRFLEVNGRRIHYVEWEKPGAPTVILLHGQSGFWYDWSEVAPRLADTYHVIAIDHPGFGDSDWDPTGQAYLVSGFAKDLEQIVHQLGLKRFTLVGHSFGGRISLAFAVAHPEQVRAVVLADSSPDVDPQARSGISRSGSARTGNPPSSVWLLTVSEPSVSTSRLNPDFEHTSGAIGRHFPADDIRALRRREFPPGLRAGNARCRACPTGCRRK